MNILITYATYSGSTMVATELSQQVLQTLGHQVIIKKASEVAPADFTAAEAIMLASPSWDFHGSEGMPHEDYQQAFTDFQGVTFPNKKFAVMGLGDSHFTKFCGAADHLENWVATLQGQLVLPTLRLDQYYINEAENSEKVKLWTKALSDSLA